MLPRPDPEDVIQLLERNVVDVRVAIDLRIVGSERRACGLGNEEEYHDECEHVERGEYAEEARLACFVVVGLGGVGCEGARELWDDEGEDACVESVSVSAFCFRHWDGIIYRLRIGWQRQLNSCLPRD